MLAGLAPPSQSVACNKGEKGATFGGSFKPLQRRKGMQHYDQTTTLRHSVQPYKNATLWHATNGLYAPLLHTPSLHATSCTNAPLVHAPKDHPTILDIYGIHRVLQSLLWPTFLNMHQKFGLHH